MPSSYNPPAGGGGSGDVVGPGSATDGALALFDGTTGKLVKDGGAPPAAFDPTSPGPIGATTPSTVAVVSQSVKSDGGGAVFIATAAGTLVFGSTVGDSDSFLQLGGLILTGSIIRFPNVPTSDPAAAGQLWNNLGILTVSSG